METLTASDRSGNFASRLKNTIVNSPVLKRWIHFLLIPSGQARPRWITKKFVNPFFHQKASSARIQSTVRMDVFPFNAFALGAQSTIEDFSVVNNGVGDVRIGSGVRVGIGDVIMGPVDIGNNTIIGQHTLITGLDHNYTDPNIPIKDQGVSTRRISIGENCFIGANANILPGVSIGKHCVVAAGSVVTKSFPDYHIIAGNPAKAIKKYDSLTSTWVRI